MPLARVGARTESTTRYSYNARRGQLPRTRIGIVRRTRARHAVCAEGLHFSAFHCYNNYMDICSKVNGGELRTVGNSGQRQFLQRIGRRRRPRWRESFPTAACSVPYRRRCRRRPIRCKNCRCPELPTVRSSPHLPYA